MKSLIARIFQQCLPILLTPLESALEKSHSNQEATEQLNNLTTANKAI